MESGFLEVLVAHPELLVDAQGRLDPSWFRDPACRELATLLLGPPARDPSVVLADPELAPEVRALLSGLLAKAQPVRAPQAALAEGIDSFTRRVLEAERRALKDELRHALGTPGDEARVQTITERMQETARASRALAPGARRKETA
jgi:hypothetical protein